VQQPVDVGQQPALDVPQVGVGPGVDEHKLGDDVRMGPRGLQRDPQGDRLPQGTGDIRGDQPADGGDSLVKLHQRPHLPVIPGPRAPHAPFA
jgi:hypothetical protein